MHLAPWTPLALAALALWGVWGLLTKVAALSLPPRSVYLIGLLGYLPVAALLLLEPGPRLPWAPAGWAAALGAGLCTAFGLFCYFKSLAAGGQAAVVVPLTSLYPLITVALSCLLLQETLTLRHALGLLSALAAVWLLAE
jgi:transporter family protein